MCATTLEKPRCFPKHRQLLASLPLTAPSPHSSPLSQLSPAAADRSIRRRLPDSITGGGGSEQRRRPTDSPMAIEDSNAMGTEVLPAVDSKGKQPLHPMPGEVELSPTAEEDPKTPEGGNDEGMEDPPQQQAPQLRPLPSGGWPNSLLQGHSCTEA
ncbi:uncharacterized protein LOC119348913 [Triticum dicoccoides]|uniref:uncharacterized protein LOC119348913 n=1 Tax=Triticum dicoccoides TaxID=85692 RepID=UPI00189025B4|nr:uncharacterized protein LOC119348913 [Triticum dicoccoides]